jgi:hypothetical protein
MSVVDGRNISKGRSSEGEAKALSDMLFPNWKLNPKHKFQCFICGSEIGGNSIVCRRCANYLHNNKDEIIEEAIKDSKRSLLHDHVYYYFPQRVYYELAEVGEPKEKRKYQRRDKQEIVREKKAKIERQENREEKAREQAEKVRTEAITKQHKRIAERFYPREFSSSVEYVGERSRRIIKEIIFGLGNIHVSELKEALRKHHGIYLSVGLVIEVVNLMIKEGENIKAVGIIKEKEGFDILYVTPKDGLGLSDKFPQVCGTKRAGRSQSGRIPKPLI